MKNASISGSSSYILHPIIREVNIELKALEDKMYPLLDKRNYLQGLLKSHTSLEKEKVYHSLVGRVSSSIESLKVQRGDIIRMYAPHLASAKREIENTLPEIHTLKAKIDKLKFDKKRAAEPDDIQKKIRDLSSKRRHLKAQYRKAIDDLIAFHEARKNRYIGF